MNDPVPYEFQLRKCFPLFNFFMWSIFFLGVAVFSFEIVKRNHEKKEIHKLTIEKLELEIEILKQKKP